MTVKDHRERRTAGAVLRPREKYAGSLPIDAPLITLSVADLTVPGTIVVSPAECHEARERVRAIKEADNKIANEAH